ncbi:MAG: aminoglycoside phosphotransferase [Hydrocarboniphaga sp.]|uniref:phosphotransferase family protein n=1 Tax=Hydrocarboniphaga sp. TaxID=2033016 RepID=UPI00260D2FB8|nr:phosphotransferase family protein [Hydrocarboniphaga sp.]MDB5969966.1 aminoglycoside phosphotransferase [Hydrocarboniphaga sp.]
MQWSPLVDRERLLAWMDQQKLERGPIVNAQLLTGGTQNVLLRFRRGEREFVLRRPPLKPLMDGSQTMRREARLLAALAHTDVPHPRLIAACASDEVIGSAFYLMEPIEGFLVKGDLPARHASTPAMRRRMGFSVIDGITALGRVDYVAVGLADFGKAEGYLERQIRRWRQQLDHYAVNTGWPGIAGLPYVDEVERWLEAHRPARFTPGILHGDYHLANVMFRHDAPELAAIVDWELATIGDPLIDLGWLLAIWPGEGAVSNPLAMEIRPWDGFPTADELIARYAENSTRDLSAVSWYAVFACYKLAIILEGTYARAYGGQATHEVGAELHGYARALFERAREWIEA